MGTLATAFAVAGIAVVCYLTWLGLQQHRLRQRLDTLEALVGEERAHESWSRAA
jgi:CcmD family protein